MSKSYVGMSAHYCPICYKAHDEQVLLNTRLKDSFEDGTKYNLGWKLCPTHKAMEVEYIALVVVVKNERPTGPEDAVPTGTYVHIRRSAWPNIFNTPAPKTPMAYCDQDTIDKLAKIPQEPAA